MKTINLLVIDDDKKAVERAMKHLKRNDIEDILGEYIVDDSIMNTDKVEDYCPSTYPVEFNAVLIDYQLIGQKFTGILVSAWMALHLGIPRIALTTATYNGPSNYFDEFIRKDEIIDNPQNVIYRISSCVENFNYTQWLETQYKELVDKYNELLVRSEQVGLIAPEIQLLEKLEVILDKYERILDAEQEDLIKTKFEYLDSSRDFLEREAKHDDAMKGYQEKLDLMLQQLEEN